MSTWSIGSVADFVQNVVEDIPDYISGANLIELAQQQLNFVEQFTGISIGSTSIDEKYQPILWKLTAAEVLNLMSLKGIDTSNIRLGEFSVSKGKGSTTNTAAENLRKEAMEELKSAVGTRIKFYKVLG